MVSLVACRTSIFFITYPPLPNVLQPGQNTEVISILLHVFLPRLFHMAAAWSGALCHQHSRLCSSEAFTSRTRCWTAARPSRLCDSVILPARRYSGLRSRAPTARVTTPFPSFPSSACRRARPYGPGVVLAYSRSSQPPSWPRQEALRSESTLLSSFPSA